MPSEALFKILHSVDSTNNYAMGMVHAGLAKHGMSWFAEVQTAGKGQRGKTWKGAPKENIALSIALQPKKLYSGHKFALSMAIALASFDLFSTYAPDETKIKWPNDLYWRDRKAGGILIENVFQGNNWKWAVAGIGININQSEFDPSLSNPVSLSQITGHDHEILGLAKQLYDLVMKRFNELTHRDSFELSKEYNQHLYKLNASVRLKKESRIFETTVKEVSLEGQLITVDAMEHHFDFGEVEWLH